MCVCELTEEEKKKKKVLRSGAEDLLLKSSGCFRDKCRVTTELVNKLECILKQQLHLTAHIPLLFLVFFVFFKL